MGKRSTFERLPRDFYRTPLEAVKPLLPHLPAQFKYIEPCAGDGALIEHLTRMTDGQCVWASDIEPQTPNILKADALTENFQAASADMYVTNSPWRRDLLLPMLEKFSDHLPTWMLTDSDLLHTKQFSPYMPRIRKIVSVGRVKWIEGSANTGKDNAIWIMASRPMDIPTIFVGRQ